MNIKTVFDHIKEIKGNKNPEYYKNLSDADIKNFNKYVILMGLSMDQDAIINVSFISKYMDLLPNESFYKICCELTPKSYKYSKWIKSTKQQFSKTLLTLLSTHFKISRAEAYDYCVTYFKDEDKIKELIDILSGHGISDKNIEKILEGKEYE
jgi:microsomal dipeptidase-like Zn-dependent dipeptidase